MAISRRRWDISLRVTSAILAVAAPALVTYEPPDDAETIIFMTQENFRVLVIFLVGFAGASVTLQAVFAFDRKYANSRLTSAKLSEIHRKLETDVLFSELATDEEAYRILRNSLEDAIDLRSRILSQYVEEDINTILSTEARVLEAQKRKDRDGEGDRSKSDGYAKNTPTLQS